MEEERLTTVERDNRILLQKMAYIMKYGGSVDNQKHDYKKKSLNKTKRQRELLRITHENLAILKRITAKEPHYNHLRWKHENQINQQYLNNISKFPHKWRQGQSHYKLYQMQQLAANERIRQQVETSQQQNTAESALTTLLNQKRGSLDPKSPPLIKI
ncbi:unnamed protein product [Mytilus coruscus]|uniref:Cilia- and flagella-associated protein 97 n=1 Tax=Mytilus coruscus TaxID=42192 RepID=A0A6J8BGU2_MYTCO|nr:unnamed protein product [Mytilus coruscus]